jgi:hypothetical protein
MRPGDDVAPLPRRRCVRKEDRAGDGDCLVVEAGRAIEDAIGLGVGERAADLRPYPQDVARFGGADLGAETSPSETPVPASAGRAAVANIAIAQKR